jgi:hypothetical protein
MLGSVLVGAVLVGAVLAGAVLVDSMLAGVVGVASAVVWVVAGVDALEEDPLEELPHAPKPTQASGTTSSAIAVGTRFLVLIRGMALLRIVVCARIIRSAAVLPAIPLSQHPGSCVPPDVPGAATPRAHWAAGREAP